MGWIVFYAVIILTIACVLYMFKQLFVSGEVKHKQPLSMTLKLGFSGVVAFLADTVGVGSFAVNIAICRTLKLVEDAQLPALINGAQVIPGAIEAVFFLTAIKVDALTLCVLVLGAALGGFLGGFFASKVKPTVIRLFMIFAFSGMVILLLTNIFQWIPIGGHLMALSGWKLGVGFIGLVVAGFLSCMGIGLFAVVQAILFLLGMSPIVAFPIMTAAGAIQQPIATATFVFNKQVPLKKAFTIALFGIIGVAIGFLVVSHMSTKQLHWLLVIVILYNIITLSRSYLNDRKMGKL